MPNNNEQVPRSSVFPGDVALAFNNQAPPAGQSSQQFGLPSYVAFLKNGRRIRWQTHFGTVPVSVSIVPQSAMNDADAQDSAIDTSHATGGETRTVTGLRGDFLRTKVSAISGSLGVTVRLLG